MELKSKRKKNETYFLETHELLSYWIYNHIHMTFLQQGSRKKSMLLIFNERKQKELIHFSPMSHIYTH